jgi:hypothetical protein
LRKSNLARKTAYALTGVGLLAVACIDGLGQVLPIQNDSGDFLPFDHQLRIARHVDQPFSDARVDRILAEAGGILASVETECPDVATPVTFTRTGEIATFTTADNFVTSEAQLDAIFDVDADIKIVTFMVGVCGAPAGNDPSVVLGCAATGASVTISHDAPTDVWAHEWGHVQGLPHRDTCPRNLMHAFELQTNAVNATERAAFLTPTPGRGMFRALAESPTGCVLRAAPSGAGPAERIRHALGRRYLQGIPQQQLADFSPGDRADLLSELLASNLAAHEKANALRALGHCGQPAACAAILGSLAEFDGPLDADELAAVVEGLLALGRLADADTSGLAVATLRAGTDAAYWAERDVALVLADGSEVPVAAGLARVGVMALGLGRSDDARTHLESLQAEVQTATRQRTSRQPLDPWLPIQIEDALSRMSGETLRQRPTVWPNRQP